MRIAGARTATSGGALPGEAESGGPVRPGRDHPRSVPPWLTAMLCLALALGVALLVVWLVRPFADYLHPNTGHDFLLIYAAATALRHSQNPYDPATLLRYTLMAGMPLRFLVYSGQFDQPYVYPPLFAWLVMPLTSLDPSRALLAWRILCAGAVLAGTYGLTAPWERTSAVFATRQRRLVFALIVTISPIALYALYWANPVVLVYAAMGGWVWALTRGTMRWDVAAGVLMSVALLKFQLALPLAVLSAACLVVGPGAWARRRRVACGFLGACAVWLALDVLTTGPALLLDWPRSILYLSHVAQMYPDMPSLLGLLQSWVQGLSQRAYIALSLVIGGATVALVAALYWRLRQTVLPAPLFALLAAIWCFGAPYGHANDELLLLPGGLAVLVALLASRRGSLFEAERHPGSAAYRRVREHAVRAAPVLAVAALALLYLGGTPHFMDVAGYRPSWGVVVLAPLALLLALGPAVAVLVRDNRQATIPGITRAGGHALAMERAHMV